MLKISLPLNLENTMEDVSASPIPLVGIVIILVMLNVVIILQDFYSSFRCIYQFLLSAKILTRKLCIDRNIGEMMLPREIQLARNKLEFAENVVDEKLSIEEVKMMMERLETLCDQDGDEERLGSKEIDNLFEEEPSVEEVKEAFDLFDENNDGFIDAKELQKVLRAFGFTEASEAECKRMIRTFDDNGDGRIDFDEFVKLVENSFC